MYLDPQTHQELLRLKELTRIPVAEYLREAVDDLLKKYAATLHPSSGKSRRGSE